MAGRGRSSSQKRQKERARLERRQEKAEKKQDRKKGIPGEEGISDMDLELGPFNLGPFDDENPAPEQPPQ